MPLARSILASAIIDIDDIVSDIETGNLNLSKQSAKILTNIINDLMANSDDIGDKTVDIPDTFPQLNGQVVAKLNRDEFVETFGRGLPVKTGDRINAILDLIGYQKKYACRVGPGADAIRHYFAVPKFDGIDVKQIFDYWFDRDMKSQENSGDDSGDFARA